MWPSTAGWGLGVALSLDPNRPRCPESGSLSASKSRKHTAASSPLRPPWGSGCRAVSPPVAAPRRGAGGLLGASQCVDGLSICHPVVTRVLILSLSFQRSHPWSRFEQLTSQPSQTQDFLEGPREECADQDASPAVSPETTVPLPPSEPPFPHIYNEAAPDPSQVINHFVALKSFFMRKLPQGPHLKKMTQGRGVKC